MLLSHTGLPTFETPSLNPNVNATKYQLSIFWFTGVTDHQKFSWSNSVECVFMNFSYKQEELCLVGWELKMILSISTEYVNPFLTPLWKWSFLYPLMRNFPIKAEPRIHLFSDNSREYWTRIGEQVMGGSAYSYILAIRHYASNRFLALPNFWKRWILANTVCESQFSRLLVNLCKNARKCYEYSVFAYSQRIDVCVVSILRKKNSSQIFFLYIKQNY